ncbi:MAG: redoxin domain-containing protein [Chloroflexi bacterium]|nr:redoxin domain-containing protein [Chloroflexota bacterium]
MKTTYTPKLRDQQVVPDFRLPSHRQSINSAADYRQRSNLVIVFFHSVDCPDCQQYLRQLADSYPSFQQAATEILAISIISVEGAKKLADDLHLPFPVLADDLGRLAEQYTYIDQATRTPVPAVFVVDRFGAVFFQSLSQIEADLPRPDEILGWLDLIELQCPECGVSEWTMPNMGADYQL